MKERLSRVMGVLASKWFLLSLVVAWVFYYVTFFIWRGEAFAGFVEAIGKNPLVSAPYVVFLISALLNLVRASRVRMKDSRLLFLLWVFLPSGALVFLVGFFLSASFMEFEWLVRGEGEEVKPRWQDAPYTLKGIAPSLKDEMLELKRGDFGIFQYEPKAVIDTGGSLSEIGVFPPKKIGGTYYHILQFGMAPGIRLSGAEGVLEEGYVILRILPPGAADSFELPPYPYRFFLRITPDRVVARRNEKVKVYNLGTPSYGVTVLKGEKTLFEGDSRDGVDFEGLSLSFGKPTYWVMIEAAKNPGLPLVAAGLSIMLVGLPLALIYSALRLLRVRYIDVGLFPMDTV